MPRSVGTFLISRVETSMKDSAVSRTRLISSTEKSWMPRMSFLIQFHGSTSYACLCGRQGGLPSRGDGSGVTCFPRSPPRPCRLFSVRLTLTASHSDEGRFLPTKSARMGSSRWPRSMRTASWISFGLPKSMRASMAARIVRPVKRTSSTRTTFFSSSEKGISVFPNRGFRWEVERSSR